MKTIKDKQILVGADFAGYPLKEAVVAHLKEYGWTVTDVGVRSPEDTDTDLMFHRIGLRVGSMISEGEFAEPEWVSILQQANARVFLQAL